MAVYDQEQGFQSILNAALGDEYQSKEFRLLDRGGQVLELYYEDECIAMLVAQDSVIPKIHKACREYLEWIVAS